MWAAVAILLVAADPDALRCQQKIDEIESYRAKPGAVYVFTSRELNAYASAEVPNVVPQGVRDPRLELGTNSGMGFAYVDFLKMQHAQGTKPNWLVAKLIEGERPLRVFLDVQSGGGRATVRLQRVEISGVAASGTVLTFLIDTFFRPLYPNAKINQPFEIGYNVDRVEVRPEAARVFIFPGGRFRKGPPVARGRPSGAPPR
jgi:hypothetical protein